MLHFFKRQTALTFFIILAFTAAGTAQKSGQKKKTDKETATGTPVLWHGGNVGSRDLFNGPGGDSMKPDLSNITFIEREKTGHNKKYRIKDGSGHIWVAKPGSEARPETAAVRLLYGLGYETEINYLVPEMTIPSVGALKNVRLEARPDGVKRLDEWSWKSNPFVGTNELQGLKIMQVFMTNYDLLDLQNKVLKVDGPNGPELHYIISDLGSTFGRFGSNNLPIFFRLGRANDKPQIWNKAKFIKGVKNGRIQFATTGMKSRALVKDISIEQGRWLFNQLSQLSDEQLRGAFRAANYSPAEIDLLLAGIKRRIDELDRATSDRLAKNKK
ncbi:MAG TPA: hypothetical protein VEV84_13620 [Pyrinomonadaceae bacterium]|nr:hypothetical protein [Pyrinomonadaceae bacterium]